MGWRRIVTAFAFLLTMTPAEAGDNHLPLVWNAKPDQPACAITENAVWVRYSGGQDCIRYFTSGNIHDAALVIVVLRGDRVNWVRRDPATIPDNTVAAQQRQAKQLAKRTGFPVIIMARPGTFGSSGNHFKRRQAAEFLALNAALDVIRQRYNLHKIVLSGHSGGATAAAALLTLGRSDVACAVMTSGAYGLLERAQMLRAEAGRKPKVGFDTTGLAAPYDPLEHIAGIVSDPDREIFVIGNLADRITPYILQRRFAQTLDANAHKVKLLMYRASPPDYHNLRDDIGLKTAVQCAKKYIQSH